MFNNNYIIINCNICIQCKILKEKVYINIKKCCEYDI